MKGKEKELRSSSKDNSSMKNRLRKSSELQSPQNEQPSVEVRREAIEKTSDQESAKRVKINEAKKIDEVVVKLEPVNDVEMKVVQKKVAEVTPKKIKFFKSRCGDGGKKSGAETTNENASKCQVGKGKALSTVYDNIDTDSDEKCSLERRIRTRSHLPLKKQVTVMLANDRKKRLNAEQKRKVHEEFSSSDEKSKPKKGKTPEVKEEIEIPIGRLRSFRSTTREQEKMETIKKDEGVTIDKKSTSQIKKTVPLKNTSKTKAVDLEKTETNKKDEGAIVDKKIIGQVKKAVPPKSTSKTNADDSKKKYTSKKDVGTAVDKKIASQSKKSVATKNTSKTNAEDNEKMDKAKKDDGKTFDKKITSQIKSKTNSDDPKKMDTSKKDKGTKIDKKIISVDQKTGTTDKKVSPKEKPQHEIIKKEVKRMETIKKGDKEEESCSKIEKKGCGKSNAKTEVENERKTETKDIKGRKTVDKDPEKVIVKPDEIKKVSKATDTKISKDKKTLEKNNPKLNLKPDEIKKAVKIEKEDKNEERRKVLKKKVYQKKKTTKPTTCPTKQSKPTTRRVKQRRIASLNAAALTQCMYEKVSSLAFDASSEDSSSTSDSTCSDSNYESEEYIPKSKKTKKDVKVVNKAKPLPKKKAAVNLEDANNDGETQRSLRNKENKSYEECSSPGSSSDSNEENWVTETKAKKLSNTILKVIKITPKTSTCDSSEEEERNEEAKKDKCNPENNSENPDDVKPKRMASLNAAAILAATSSFCTYNKKSNSTPTPAENSNEAIKIEGDSADSRAMEIPDFTPSSQDTNSANPRIDSEIQNTSETVVTDTHISSSTTHHSEVRRVSGFEFHISATSHMETETTTVVKENKNPVGTRCPEESLNMEVSRRSPNATYTPLIALSSMHPPGSPQHETVHTSPERRSLRPMAPKAIIASSSSSFVRGYYQPAGPLISHHHHHHHYHHDSPRSLPSSDPSSIVPGNAVTFPTETTRPLPLLHHPTPSHSAPILRVPTSPARDVGGLSPGIMPIRPISSNNHIDDRYAFPSITTYSRIQSFNQCLPKVPQPQPPQAHTHQDTIYRPTPGSPIPFGYNVPPLNRQYYPHHNYTHHFGQPPSMDAFDTSAPSVLHPYQSPHSFYLPTYGGIPGQYVPSTSRTVSLIESAYPYPLHQIPKNLDSGPLAGSRGPLKQQQVPLSPIALAIPHDHGVNGPPSPARGSVGSYPPSSPAIGTARNPSMWMEHSDEVKHQEPKKSNKKKMSTPLIEKNDTYLLTTVNDSPVEAVQAPCLVQQKRKNNKRKMTEDCHDTEHKQPKLEKNKQEEFAKMNKEDVVKTHHNGPCNLLTTIKKEFPVESSNGSGCEITCSTQENPTSLITPVTNEPEDESPTSDKEVDDVNRLILRRTSSAALISSDKKRIAPRESPPKPVKRRKRKLLTMKKKKTVPKPIKVEVDQTDAKLITGLVSQTKFSKLRFSNGWSWKGEPFTGKVFIDNNSPEVIRKCYNSMIHTTGDVICPQDCVLLKSGSKKNDMPFIAKVTKLWENPENGEMMMSLLWYYRVEHTNLMERNTDTTICPYELFASKHKDTNSVACIEDKCYVLTYNEYCRFRKEAKRMEQDVMMSRLMVPPVKHENYYRHNMLPPESTSPELVFFCRKLYDIRSNRLLKHSATTMSSCKT